LLDENFDDVGTLGTPVDEIGRAGGIYDNQNVWTTNPTSGLDGWSMSTSATTANGADEWAGWSIANYNFWEDVAGGQQRELFTKASGNVAVADPDEYDDYQGGIAGLPGSMFNAFMTTNVMSLANVDTTQNLVLDFDSSWRPEGFDDGDGTNNQTGIIVAKFNDGSMVEVLKWDSDALGSFFHADNVNEDVMVMINAAGKTSVQLEFSLTNARNDWWWAVDNVKLTGVEAVPEPATMTVLALGALAALRKRKSN
jgi:hypothetical protein